VHIFPRPKADEVHEFPTFTNAVSPTGVTWMLLRDIGLPVVIESLSGQAGQRGRRKVLVALGGTRTWQVQDIEPEAGTVFTERRGVAIPDADNSDVDSDSDTELRSLESSDSDCSEWSESDE
jgi:hypothetical protein